MFTWHCELGAWSESSPDDLAADGLAPAFESQLLAESWLGERYLELVDHGVEAVSLLEGGAVVYGPMPLQAG